jgi:hypothetical protein
MDARRKESEVYKSSSVLEESEDKSHPAVFETTVKPQAGISILGISLDTKC